MIDVQLRYFINPNRIESNRKYEWKKYINLVAISPSLPPNTVTVASNELFDSASSPVNWLLVQHTRTSFNFVFAQFLGGENCGASVYWQHGNDSGLKLRNAIQLVLNVAAHNTTHSCNVCFPQFQCVHVKTSTCTTVFICLFDDVPTSSATVLSCCSAT